MRNVAQRILGVFYQLRGSDPVSRHKPKEKLPFSVAHPRYKGTYGFKFAGKPGCGARPAGTYRAARRNAMRGTRARDLKLERLARGLTRSELDRARASA